MFICLLGVAEKKLNRERSPLDNLDTKYQGNVLQMYGETVVNKGRGLGASPCSAPRVSKDREETRKRKEGRRRQGSGAYVGSGGASSLWAAMTVGERKMCGNPLYQRHQKTPATD